jgi:hypothetical protein
MNIPTTKSSIQLDLLHPRFVTRLEAFFSDSRIKNRVAVSSGCRSYAAQLRLYQMYRAGKGNLAANPDWQRPDGFFRGSFHQEQPDGYSYAVDLHQLSKSISKPDINKIAVTYGVVPTIQAKEWWHHQPRNGKGWFDAPALKGEASEGTEHVAPLEPKVDWAGIMAAISAQRTQVTRKPLIRGSRGPAVKTTQSRLGALGFDCGPADGIYGRKTAWAVKQLQKKKKLPTTGTVDARTFDALFT